MQLRTRGPPQESTVACHKKGEAARLSPLAATVAVECSRNINAESEREPVVGPERVSAAHQSAVEPVALGVAVGRKSKVPVTEDTDDDNAEDNEEDEDEDNEENEEDEDEDEDNKEEEEDDATALQVIAQLKVNIATSKATIKVMQGLIKETKNQKKKREASGKGTTLCRKLF